MVKVFTLLVFFFSSFIVTAQTRVLVSAPLNTKGGQEFSPSISGDGKTMVFLSKLGDGLDTEFMISYLRSGAWSKPELLTSINTPIKTIYTGDLSISHDGNTIVYTSGKYGGIGGSDIVMTEKKGNVWQAASNLGKPINTTGQEGDASLSPDNKYLYFVRYTASKTPNGLPCGKIYKAEQIAGTNTWKEPVALAAPINQTCECNPRIAADGRTLYFASMRAGGKGGYDQYFAKQNIDGSWTTPKALTLINTPADNRYMAISAQGTTVFYTVDEKGLIDIATTMLPADLQPDKVIYWKGLVKDATSQKILPARIVITDKKTNKLNIIQCNTDGSFNVFLPQGNTYDVAVQSNEKGKLYYSTLFELDALDKYKEIEQNITLKPIAPQASIVLSNIGFESGTATLTPFSTPELNRIVSFLKDNPTARIEIGAHTYKVIEDSIKAADLTEVRTDTLQTITDDSTGIVSYQLKTTYSNDRTKKQANAIADYITAKGIPASRFTYKGYGDKEPLQPTPADPLLNRRVVLKIM